VKHDTSDLTLSLLAHTHCMLRYVSLALILPRPHGASASTAGLEGTLGSSRYEGTAPPLLQLQPPTDVQLAPTHVCVLDAMGSTRRLRTVYLGCKST
jgi:hypothetical protein